MAKMFTKNGDEYEEIDGFTQDEVDHIIEKRVARERQKYTDYDSLKSQVDDLNTKLKTASDEKTELEKKLGAAQLETDRIKVIHKFNVPEKLQEFVTGKTVEDMSKQAEKPKAAVYQSPKRQSLKRATKQTPRKLPVNFLARNLMTNTNQ